MQRGKCSCLFNKQTEHWNKTINDVTKTKQYRVAQTLTRKRELGWAVYVGFSMLVFEFGLVWFSIRGSCQLLSLIEIHT